MKTSFAAYIVEKFLRIVLFFVILCGLIIALAMKASAQINVQQVPSDSKDTYSFEIKNVSGGSLSLQNWGLFHDSSVLMHAPDFSVLYLVPNGSAIVDLNKNFTDINKLLKLKKINGKTVDEFIHIFPKKDQTLLKDLFITGKFLWTVLVKSGLTQFVASLVQATPLSSPSPTPSAIPASTSPTIAPSPSPTNTPPTQPLPSPIEIQPPTPPVYPSPIAAPDPSPNNNSNFPSSLQLQELLACPQPHEHQWLKIFNPDNESYELSKWKLKNAKGKTRLISGQLTAKSEVTITLTSSFMSRSGDMISLERPDGVTVFSISFPDCKKERGKIFSFSGAQSSSPSSSSDTSESSAQNQNQQSTSALDTSQTTTDSSQNAEPSGATFSFPNLSSHESQPAADTSSSDDSATIDNPSSDSATDSTINDILGASNSADFATADAELATSSSSTPTMQTAANIGLILFVLSGVALFITGSISFYLWYKKRSSPT